MSSNNSYKITEIVDILTLDETEYDTNISPEKLIESLDGVLITKIMGFDINYDQANKYILSIMKNISSEKNYDKYKKNIYDILKNILFGDFDNEYYKNLISNISEYKNKDYLLSYFEYLQENELFEFLSKINEMPKSNRYEILNIITKSKILRKLLLKKSIDGYNYEGNINLYSIMRFRDDFDINDDEYINIIKNYLIDDESTEELISFTNDILDKNKILGSTTLSLNMVDYKKLSSFRFLSLTLKICMFMFNSIDKNNIFRNIEKDFNSTQRKEYIPSIDDTLETKIYLLALKGFRIIHNSILISYNQSLLYEEEGDLLSYFINFNQMEIKKKIKILKDIVLNEKLDNSINNLVDFYTKNFLQINSDAVDSVIQYYFNIKKIKKDYIYSKEIIEYFYKLLATSTEYCNEHYKFDILTLICSVYNNKDSELKDNLDLLKAIILYHDENDMFKTQEREISHKYYQESLKILEKILSLSTINENSMNDLFLKFFYKTNSHTITHLEFLNYVCTEIDKKITDYNSQAFRSQFIVMVREVMKSINISLKVVNDILNKKILNPAIFRGEIILPVITLATNVLKFFTNGKIAIYNVFGMNFESLDIMKLSLHILHKLTVNDEFIDLIQDTKDIILESLPYIKFNVDEQFVKEELKEHLKNSKDNIKLEDIPEEFLDPLIYTLIKEPVMIPNVDLIFDKTSIMCQIYHEKINPYTREFLDENIIEEHNKKEDIILKVYEFTNKLNEFKLKNHKI